MRLRPAALVLLLLSVGSVRADMVTLSVASEYTPGTPFTVQVGLSPVFNLGLYNVEVVFRTTGPVAGLLSVNDPAAAGSGYVFPTADNFFGSRVESGNEYRVTLSDFTLDPTGPDVAGGVNDQLATLTVLPAAGLTSSIDVFIDRTSLFIDDANGLSLLTDGTLPTATVTPTAVPAPAGVIGLAGVVLVLAARRRLFAVLPSGI